LNEYTKKIPTEKNYLRALCERMMFSLIAHSMMMTTMKKTILFILIEYIKKNLALKKTYVKKKFK